MMKLRTEMGAMRRGSVMMEFIIVFPIYLILFAATFILGDMLIHSNRLACGDVVNAYVRDLSSWGEAASAKSMYDFYKSNVLHYEKNSGPIEELVPRADEFFADNDGSWAGCKASTFAIRYKPTIGGGLGQLLAVESLVGGMPHHEGEDRSAIDDWRDGSAAGMKSKGGNILFQEVFGDENDMKSHCFYVLTRTPGGGYINGKWQRTGPWRWLTSGLLKNDRWLNEVLNDGWHNGATIQKMYTNSGSDEGSNIAGYERYDTFVNLSD